MFINVFLANVTISHHLRTLENLLLSGVFRGGGGGVKWEYWPGMSHTRWACNG